jgi:hypothetical protein
MKLERLVSHGGSSMAFPRNSTSLTSSRCLVQVTQRPLILAAGHRFVAKKEKKLVTYHGILLDAFGVPLVLEYRWFRARCGEICMRVIGIGRLKARKAVCLIIVIVACVLCPAKAIVCAQAVKLDESRVSRLSQTASSQLRSGVS